MAKISIRRPRIISKKFPEVNSTIDGVEKSLNDLVFTYSEHIDRTLQKKHIMMAASSMVLLLVLGSFISPRGKAESSVFYPDTCLGGWINPQYAQGEQETTSNGDESQFTKHNSAVLPKNTNAEMYCGNFKGKFDQTTKPTKIIVSLALTKGVDLLTEDMLESGIVSSSSIGVISSTTDELILATSTTATTTLQVSATSSESIVSSSTEGGVSSSTVEFKEVTASSGPATATAVPSAPLQETTSAIGDVIDSVKNSIINLFEKNKDPAPVTDTVVVPTQVEQTTTPLQDTAPVLPSGDIAPTSYLLFREKNILSFFVQRVFAEEIVTTTTTQQEPVPPQKIDAPTLTNVTEVAQNVQDQAATTSESEVSATSSVDSSISQVSTTTNDNAFVQVPAPESILGQIISTSSSFFATTTEATSSEVMSATTTEDDNQFQNNFLEVLYTFDGLTWTSLGELNEISMKYRTFEIPVTATTSWEDMSRLQIKIVANKHTLDTPTVYLDAIKVEVLYETTLMHAHPDFARDTILKDETIGDMRIVTIVNSETKLEEIWYMYLDTTVSATGTVILDSTSTAVDSNATTTSGTTTTKMITHSASEGTTTQSVTVEGTTTTSTTAPSIRPVVQKNVWIKFEGTRKEGVSLVMFAQEIRKTDEQKLLNEEEKKRQLPDFALDIIKRIKGTFMNSVIVQLEKEGKEELWMYDLEKGTEEKVDTGTSTSLSVDSPLGVKDGYVFWLSGDSTKVYAYNISTKEIKEQAMPAYDTSKGERAEVAFPGISWKVIVGANGFSFYSESTGEVFSDENGSVAEALRQKLNLDSILNKEELSNLNLQVEESTSTP